MKRPLRLDCQFCMATNYDTAMNERHAKDLHGSAPDKCPAALLLIDVINALDFPEGDQLLRHAIPMADSIAALKVRLKQQGVPTIYVNDNFGKWRSDFSVHVSHCLGSECLGGPIVERLRPQEDDYYVLKPKHSGFFSTSLDILLEYLEADTVVLAGMATNICVLFTANDAYMRDLRIVVPEDCVAANTREESANALQQMQSVLKADIRCSKAILIDELIRRPRQ
jgi:nicotinamidase-related amidase